MNSHELSNSISILPNQHKLKAGTKRAFAKLFNNELPLTQLRLQKLSDMICKDLSVSACPINYAGVQKATRRNGRIFNKVYGNYNTGSTKINLFKFTPTKKVVANKTQLKTLLHELCHHFDFTIIKTLRSLHTAGFYTRISNLQKELLS